MAGRFRFAWAGFAVLAGLTLASPAPAATKSAVALKMAEQAGKAYQAGDYTRAAELYLSAWRSQPDPAYLFAAARAEDVAGRDDKAEALYQRFIAAPDAAAERIESARGYLRAIHDQRVDAIAADADKALRSDARLAASLFLDGFRLAPGRVDLLFKAAVAEQDAGEDAKARAHFEQYLAQAPPDARERSQADARLAALQRKRMPTQDPKPAGEVRPLQPAPTPQAPPAIAAVAAAPEVPTVPALTVAHEAQPRSDVLGWTTTGAGAVLALSGLGLYLATRGDLEQYDRDIVPGANGRIQAISREEAVERSGSINARMGTAAALGSVGVVAAGVGAWLLWLRPESAVVAPVPGGVTLAVRF